MNLIDYLFLKVAEKDKIIESMGPDSWRMVVVTLAISQSIPIIRTRALGKGYR